MTKRFFILLFINLILVLFQLGTSFVPNLVLAFSFALVFSNLGNTGKMSAFLGGLFLDLLGFNIVGFSPVIIVGCMIMYDFVRRNISKGILINALAVVFSTLVYDGVLGFSAKFFASEAVVGALFTLALCEVFYVLIRNYKLSE